LLTVISNDAEKKKYIYIHAIYGQISTKSKFTPGQQSDKNTAFHYTISLLSYEDL